MHYSMVMYIKATEPALSIRSAEVWPYISFTNSYNETFLNWLNIGPTLSSIFRDVVGFRVLEYHNNSIVLGIVWDPNKAREIGE